MRTLCFVMLCLCFQAWGQSPCECSYSISEAMHRVEQDDSVQLFQFTNQLRRQTPCAIHAARWESEYLLNHKNYRASFTILREQERLIAQSGCTNLLIHNHLNYAQHYRAQANFDSVSFFAFQALEKAEQLQNSQLELRAITFIVHVFAYQNQDTRNGPYIKRAEEIILTTKEHENKAADLNWLAYEFETIYTLTQRMGALDTAIRYAQLARTEASRKPDFDQLTKSYRVLESAAYHKGDLKKALLYIDSALYFGKQIRKPKSLAALYTAKAWDHLDLGQPQEAIRWMDTCLLYTQKSYGKTASVINVYLEASNIYEGAGDTTRAYKAFKVYEHLKDSLFGIQRAEKINELEQKYQKARNERTIKELAQEKQIYLLIAVVGLLAAVVVAFYLRQQSLKHKKDILETEQRLNRARMNPHFFFNALTALQKFAMTGADGTLVASNLSRFSHIMRETLESTYKEYVTIEQEMEFLREYLQVQQLRFPNAFNFSINTHPELDSSSLLIPSMIVQPFVENTIEHGFGGINYQGEIKINFSEIAKEVLIEITDNGKGLNSHIRENQEHISRASQIVKDRIYLLNIKLKSKARFSIDNVKEGSGVLVKISLPVLTDK